MSRFVIEHLPRTAATYRVVPVQHEQAIAWMQKADFASLVRTTELIAAIEAAMGVTLIQTDLSMALRPGDEALLITVSFGVLLAWAEGKIVPLQEDWRFSLLMVEPAAHHALALREVELGEGSLAERG
ncbi:MAG: hypothetical protein M3Z32_08410 [Acidobacteriota bacterium]|nr:hypothetical protein [Acidobacteriota bacterium]